MSGLARQLEPRALTLRQPRTVDVEERGGLMPPTAHDTASDQITDDAFVRIQLDPPLPCGIDTCGRLTHWGQVEREPGCDSLWRLLPICEAHMLSLASAAHEWRDRQQPPDA
jgi:hypothetical protein